MRLIADSGSTKTEWRCLENGETRLTSGINPIHQSDDDIRTLLSQEFSGVQADEIYFYGAGCAYPERNEQLADLLKAHFGAQSVEVSSDMLCAARALCGRESGIACILGTGANSCLYDGEKITKNVPPLGYVLGDEGSGAVLGKRLVADVLKGLASQQLRELFFAETGFSYPQLLENVYRKPMANRFLASLTPFLSRHLDMREVKEMVSTEFMLFVERNVLQYKETHFLPVSFTGSVAWHFRSVLTQTLLHYKLQCGKITQAPMEGLAAYHLAK